MDTLSLAIIAGGLLLYSLISGRLQGTVITAPLVFILFGFTVGSGGLNVADVDHIHTVNQFAGPHAPILIDEFGRGDGVVIVGAIDGHPASNRLEQRRRLLGRVRTRAKGGGG